MQKEDNEGYVIILCYAVVMFFLISEPFVFQITNNEYIRMYGLLLFCIGAIILSVIVKNKKVVKK